jgi:hypothetical protein
VIARLCQEGDVNKKKLLLWALTGVYQTEKREPGWNDRVTLATGGWFSYKESTLIAKGYGYLLYRTTAGAYVVQDAPHLANWNWYEVSEYDAFQSLMRNRKEHAARTHFPYQYQNWMTDAQR